MTKKAGWSQLSVGRRRQDRGRNFHPPGWRPQHPTEAAAMGSTGWAADIAPAASIGGRRWSNLPERNSCDRAASVVGDPDRTMPDAEGVSARTDPLVQEMVAGGVGEAERGLEHGRPNLSSMERNVASVARRI